MSANNKYAVINIRQYLDNNDPRLGENDLKQILSEFSCEKNTDVEQFLKKQSIDFTKKNQSVTYLVLSTEDGELLGYFSITLKSLTIHSDTVSNSVERYLQRMSRPDEETGTYTLSAYLIAQLGKNFAGGANKRITGRELLEIAWNTLKDLQYKVGGTIVFLEAARDAKLLSFYEANRFKEFDTKQSSSPLQEPHELVQLLRVL